MDFVIWSRAYTAYKPRVPVHHDDINRTRGTQARGGTSQSILHRVKYFYSNEGISSESLCIPPSFCEGPAPHERSLGLWFIRIEWHFKLLLNGKRQIFGFTGARRVGLAKERTMCPFLCHHHIFPSEESLVVARSLSIRRLGTPPLSACGGNVANHICAFWSKVCVILDFASFLLDFFILLRELNWFILIYGMLWLEITI